MRWELNTRAFPCSYWRRGVARQSQIAQLIQDKGSDYCLALKGNHKYLHIRVIQLFDRAEEQD